jgi:chemotaxis protein MotB
MNLKTNFLFIALLAVGFSSCVSNKKFYVMQEGLQKDLDIANEQLANCKKNVSTCEEELKATNTKLGVKQDRIDDLKVQLEDAKAQRDKQVSQVGDLAVLSQSASDNINKTLSQLEEKDKYIRLLQTARSKADSINLALAVNLKSELKDGIEDKDIEIKVDKTVVFINLSDKMLYEKGSSNLTPKANEVLAKIAKVIESRPGFEIMVEGYTDNDPISTSCMKDNWDLSVKRATSVVRVLQDDYKVDPNRLIAAGRGEYNTLASNDSAEGKAINRRTRIIILPKLNQFYDLLNPDLATKKLD